MGVQRRSAISKAAGAVSAAAGPPPFGATSAGGGSHLSGVSGSKTRERDDATRGKALIATTASDVDTTRWAADSFAHQLCYTVHANFPAKGQNLTVKAHRRSVDAMSHLMQPMLRESADDFPDVATAGKGLDLLYDSSKALKSFIDLKTKDNDDTAVIRLKIVSTL